MNQPTWQDYYRQLESNLDLNSPAPAETLELLQIRLEAERRAWGLSAEEPAPEPTHCVACGQRLRQKKPRPDFHGLRIVKKD